MDSVVMFHRNLASYLRPSLLGISLITNLRDWQRLAAENFQSLGMSSQRFTYMPPASRPIFPISALPDPYHESGRMSVQKTDHPFR